MRAQFLSVYTAIIPSHVRVRGVFPSSRNEEIFSCSSKKAQTEKYCVWKLLEYALFESFGKRIEEISFTKSASGRWECDFCHFSLSHSHGALAVAIADRPVGVDIEKLAPIKNRAGVAKKILTAEEAEDYQRVALCNDTADEFLLTLWTKKESLFKAGGFPQATPCKIPTGEENTLTKKISLGGKDYLLSVACDNPLQAKFVENASYLP